VANLINIEPPNATSLAAACFLFALDLTAQASSSFAYSRICIARFSLPGVQFVRLPKILSARGREAAAIIQNGREAMNTRKDDALLG
jgi:hypothetical protein